ncbi:MAG: DUF1015 domain-containing protein [Chloroflexi bacterium]|nr:DUF1015 domain-containing protein [Chloroflexota bacterium]MBU1749824.1 DUF1015 domain-containing protein [Chloroflexota bacterium]MBU1877694.1 DUF1015 domain-containing protein [Chloroflexota bacterium]
MAVIKPFRGLRYNPARIPDLSAVITQPYDRIHAAEQASYYALSPYNFCRIILGRRTAADTEANNVYTRARCYDQTWQAEDVLMREPRPALYVLEQTYTTPSGETRTRRGLCAALQLTGFDEGVILPHERTLSGPKVDRLNLTLATATAWEHIFILYPDPHNRVNGLVEPFLAAHAPAVAREQIIESAVEQRFWVVDDPQIVTAVVAELAPKRNLIIADGHHRYETALNYRDEMRQQHPDAPADAAFNYVLVTLVGMSDLGLVILPTHRLIHSYGQMDGPAALEKAREFFDVTPVADRAAMEQALAQATPDHPSFGFYDGAYSVLTLRDQAVLALLLPGRAHDWHMLDVTILHELFIERVLGIDKGAVERKESLDYLRDAEPGYRAVDEGQARFLLLVNPTRIEQVQSCTEASERMPQKSTDFYPKVISGLVMMPVPAEPLG